MTDVFGLRTQRLLLRGLEIEDAPEVQRLASHRDIASTTRTIPHPYEDGMAEEWIQRNLAELQRGESVIFAIVERERETFLGTIGLTLQLEDDRAELGYWIGKPYWGCGYATEAAEAMLRFGFESLALNRIYASFLARNPASGRVMEKIGMRREGYQRQHVKKWGVAEDIVLYGILRDDYYVPHS